MNDNRANDAAMLDQFVHGLTVGNLFEFEIPTYRAPLQGVVLVQNL